LVVGSCVFSDTLLTVSDFQIEAVSARADDVIGQDLWGGRGAASLQDWQCAVNEGKKEREKEYNGVRDYEMNTTSLLMLSTSECIIVSSGIVNGEYLDQQKKEQLAGA
jgi:hypothetical protein